MTNGIEVFGINTLRANIYICVNRPRDSGMGIDGGSRFEGLWCSGECPSLRLHRLTTCPVREWRALSYAGLAASLGVRRRLVEIAARGGCSGRDRRDGNPGVDGGWCGRFRCCRCRCSRVHCTHRVVCRGISFGGPTSVNGRGDYIIFIIAWRLTRIWVRVVCICYWYIYIARFPSIYTQKRIRNFSRTHI